MDSILTYIGIWLAYTILLAIIKEFRAERMPTVSPRSSSVSTDAIIGPFEARSQRDTIRIGGRNVAVYAVLVRGRINTGPSRYDLITVTSLFDHRNGVRRPVLSTAEWQQESDSEVFQQVETWDKPIPEDGYSDWTRVAIIIPELLVAPYSGRCDLTACVRVLPRSQLLTIDEGLIDPRVSVAASASVDLVVHVAERGWLETHQQREEARETILRAAVAVAAADGEFRPEEARVIQEWIALQLEHVAAHRREAVKDRLNATFKESYLLSQDGRLSVDPLIDRLASFRMPSVNRHLMELLNNISGADSEIDAEEIAMIRSIGNRLGVSIEEIEAMSEKQFLSADVQMAGSVSAEAILGLLPGWSSAEIQNHLRREFAKWNGRIQALSDEAERAKAQSMIDMIAEMRKKYA